MKPVNSVQSPPSNPDVAETFTERLLAAAADAQHALAHGGVDITRMTREQRCAALFGHGHKE
jgi:hypothetical protein